MNSAFGPKGVHLVKRRHWLNWVWLGVAATTCGLLAFLLYERTLNSVSAYGDPTHAAASDPGPGHDFNPAPENAVNSLGDIEVFDNIVARNLFSVERTPPPVADKRTSAEPENQPDLSAELTGVISHGTERRAIVYDPNADESIVLKVGETLRSWRLQSLSSDEAVWARGEQTVAQRLWRRPEPGQDSPSTEKTAPPVQTSESRPPPGHGNDVAAQGGSATIRASPPDRREGMGTGYVPID